MFEGKMVYTRIIAVRSSQLMAVGLAILRKKTHHPKCKSCIHMNIISKRIELERPGCTGFEENSKSLKT